MSMSKKLLLGALAFVVLALLMMPLAGLAATTYTTTIQVVGPTGSAVASAPVYVYALNGTQIASGTTNSTGYASFALANGTYLVFVKGKQYFFELIKVAGTTHAVINATKMHYANITSVPASTSFTLVPDGTKVSLSLSTNATVYGDNNATVTFPSSFVSFPYIYKLSSVKNATTTVNTGSIFANMTGANQVITATYTSSMAFTSPLFLGIIAFVILIIIAGAWYAGSHAIYNTMYSYVRRATASRSKYVRSIENEEDKDRKHYVHRA
jgi:hypothetical protein